jgi:prepilin-type N-terminal cleavage/methylation domain-containing protein
MLMMRRQRQAAERAGFTMIELLVVIAIIGVLTGLLVMTIGHMSRNGKIQATRADLQNQKAMFDELSAGGGMSHFPQRWLWRNVSNSPKEVNVDPTLLVPPYSTWGLDFWLTPMRRGPVGQGGVKNYLDCLDAPFGPMTPENPMIRNASRAVLNTQLAMQILLGFPINRQALSGLPADRMMVPEWQSGPFPLGVATGADGLSNTPDDGTDTVTDVNYCVNNCVRYNGSAWRCILSHTSSNSTIPPSAATQPPQAPASNQYWQQDNNPTPILLDGWGNPIIFVPATGLINVYGNYNADMHGNAKYPLSGSDLNVAALPQSTLPSGVSRALDPITSPEGENDPNNRGQPLPTIPVGQNPRGRPFWASGGPDGDLSTGDDNLYSFQK